MKKIKFLPVIVIVGLILIACKEKAEVPTLKTHNISAIEQTVATGGGEIMSVGSSAILSAGICWDTNENPTINNSKTTDRVSDNLFISKMTNLQPNTQYYVRAYAINGEGVGYGQQVSFRTSAIIKADIKLLSPENITSGTIEKIAAEIVDDGGSPITECGFVWGKTKEPTVETNKVTATLSGNQFFAKIDGLKPDSTYFVRAFTISQAGVSYSTLFREVTMKSVATEIDITTASDSITDSSAWFMVTAKSADNLYPITERGVHWSLQTDSIVADNHVVAVETEKGFEVRIDSLAPETKYYVMPYAKNKYGIKYGKEGSFITLKKK